MNKSHITETTLELNGKALNPKRVIALEPHVVLEGYNGDSKNIAVF